MSFDKVHAALLSSGRLRSVYIIFKLGFSSFDAESVLMVYEHIITFRQEFRYFWQGKVTGASILFCLNRYLPVVQMMLDLADLNPATGRVSWSFTSKQKRNTDFSGSQLKQRCA